MNHEEFLKVVDDTNGRCIDLLGKKRKHRETSDNRLLQFDAVSALRQRSTISAVADMMVKHTTQLFAMVKEHEDGIPINPEEWNETIIDNMNYHHLMVAALHEYFTIHGESELAHPRS